jgi:NADPH-dependent 2,4-dienoyl-CoA reductase/sulfur reductase-like enzyme
MAVDMKQESSANAAIALEEYGTLVLRTNILIVGAGPAGASLACFLASHGKFQTFQEFIYECRCI